LNFFTILFPRKEREFKGDRWVSISLRTLHLIGIVGVGSGLLFDAPKETWCPYWMLCVGSGVAMICLYIWYSAIWVIQLRGIVIFFKIALVLCLPLLEGYEPHILVIVIVLSGLISHAPGAARYYSIFHRRQIEYLD
jgi:hypothetical protein